MSQKTVNPQELIEQAQVRLVEHAGKWLFARKTFGKVPGAEMVAFRKSPDFVSLSCCIGNLVLASLLCDLESHGAISCDGDGIAIHPDAPASRVSRVIWNGETFAKAKKTKSAPEKPPARKPGSSARNRGMAQRKERGKGA